MNPDQQLTMVKWVHVGLRALFWVYAALLMTWCHFALVSDFGQGLFHISFWLALEIFYISVGFSSTGFGVMAFEGMARVEAESAIKWGFLCQILSFLIGAKNVVHIVFVSMELNAATTTLAANYYWFLVMFLILLILLLLLDLAAIWMYSHYKKILGIFSSYKKYP